jgi:hypothetical protein
MVALEWVCHISADGHSLTDVRLTTAKKHRTAVTVALRVRTATPGLLASASDEMSRPSEGSFRHALKKQGNPLSITPDAYVRMLFAVSHRAIVRCSELKDSGERRALDLPKMRVRSYAYLNREEISFKHTIKAS